MATGDSLGGNAGEIGYERDKMQWSVGFADVIGVRKRRRR